MIPFVVHTNSEAEDEAVQKRLYSLGIPWSDQEIFSVKKLAAGELIYFHDNHMSIIDESAAFHSQIKDLPFSEVFKDDFVEKMTPKTFPEDILKDMDFDEDRDVDCDPECPCHDEEKNNCDAARNVIIISSKGDTYVDESMSIAELAEAFASLHKAARRVRELGDKFVSSEGVEKALSEIIKLMKDL